MAFADLTKQLAQQAILSATEDPPAPAPAPGESAGPVILGQIALMQKALKEDEELVVLYQAGGEGIRVMEVFLPSPEVAVLSGMDANRAPATGYPAGGVSRAALQNDKGPASSQARPRDPPRAKSQVDSVATVRSGHACPVLRCGPRYRCQKPGSAAANSALT